MREKAAAEAMETPVTKEKMVLPMTVATVRRPGSRRTPRLMAPYMSVIAPDRAMNSPISMNSGMTANVKSRSASAAVLASILSTIWNLPVTR